MSNDANSGGPVFQVWPAANTGRRFIGIELEPNYFQITRRRIEDALAKENSNE